MNIQIILTSYLLKFMFGENPFQDPFLLSREVIKKAYNEGLYFISNERTIDAFLKEKESDRRGNLFVFAGIPNFEDICLNLSALPTLYAVKISLPYEVLVDFQLETSHGDMVLFKENVSISKKFLEKVVLDLYFNHQKLEYRVSSSNKEIVPLAETTRFFIQNIKNYHYAISNKVKFLEEEVTTFLNSQEGLKKLEKEENLQLVKEIYEELV